MNEKADSERKIRVVIYTTTVFCLVSSFFTGIFFGLSVGFLVLAGTYTLFVLIYLVLLRKGIVAAVRASPLNAIPVIAMLFGLFVAWVAVFG